LGLSDAVQTVYLDSLRSFGGFQGKGFRTPGFGFESREFTIAHKRLYFSQARIVRECDLVIMQGLTFDAFS
jgi:hypothetical protein